MATDPFEILGAYDTRTTWERARKGGTDPAIVDRALREVPDVSPLDALAASKEAVDRLTGYRWFIMQDAREKDASWGEIADALGIGEKEAQDWYRDKITQREELVPDFHDAPRARAVLGESPAPEL